MVGASLACALKDQPLRIALVEAVPIQSDSQPSYDDRGLVIAPASQRILYGLGVWDALQADATPIERIHVSDKGHFGFTHLDAESANLPALGHVVVARAIGQALVTAIHSQDNLDFLCPARVGQVELHPDYVQVEIADADQRRQVTTRLIIVADGAQSSVRGQLGIQVREHDYQQTAIVANVSPERAHANTAYERFTSTGPLAVLPLTSQRCVVVWAVARDTADALLARDDIEFLNELTRRFGNRLGRFLKVGRRRSYPLKLIVAEEQAGPRHVVIGNAAHTIHPNAAQGLNLGLRDAAALAEQIVDALRQGQDPGDTAVLRTYAVQRHADHRRVIRFSDGLARLFYNDILPFVVGRNLAMLAVDLVPPLKRGLMRQAMGLEGRQPRLARGLPL